MYLVVGLGNPGLTYKNTRHNTGFMGVDELADKLGTHFRKKQFSGVTAEANFKGEKLLLLKPHTYMNLSGNAVRQATDYYRIPADHVIVLVDDTDLPAGKLRIREKGSSGCHNGLKSIIACLGTQEFPRIRMGIGKAPLGMPLANYVLARLNKAEKAVMARMAKDAAEAVLLYVEKGANAAQIAFH